jgi:hypothetical protein
MMATASHGRAWSYVIWVTPCGPRGIAIHHGAVTDQAIAGCGGNAREAVKALIAANDAGCVAARAGQWRRSKMPGTSPGTRILKSL